MNAPRTEAGKARHGDLCLCPADGSDPDCNAPLLAAAETYAAALVQGYDAALADVRAAVVDATEWHCSPCVSSPGDHGNISRAAMLAAIDELAR